MLFWILAAIMTFAATAALVLPLSLGRSTRADVAPEEYDVEVYRDQLTEIDRDVAEGLISTDEAGVARGEIGRRLLVVARKAENFASGNTARSASFSRFAIIALVVFMPVAALVAYLQLGAPGAPQLPLAARINQDPARTDINTLIANAERHLAATPEDGKGWDVLGPIYLRTGRIDDATNAFRKSISLLGPSAARQSGLGEALVSKAGGVVTEEARLVFQSARELDPEDPRPTFFLALANAQEGKLEEARSEFSALLERSPKDAPWNPAIQKQIAALDNAVRNENVTSGPTAADITDAMENKTPEERKELIRSMVATLDARLAENPDNIDGWLMLIRSKAMIGDLTGAQTALDRAAVTFPSGTQANLLADLAGSLSLKSKNALGGVPMPAPDVAAPNPSNLTSPEAGPFLVPGNVTAPGGAKNANGTAEPLGNPTQEDISAAAQMSVDDRQQMVRNMVASLDEKLRENPDNLEGWQRLIRSYAVLGDALNARDAVNRAKVVFADNPARSAAIDQLAAQLAIDSQE